MKKRNFIIALGTFIVLTVVYFASIVVIESQPDPSEKRMEVLQNLIQSQASKK